VPLSAIGLLVFAGLLHSLGNQLSKRGRDNAAFLWLVLVCVAVVGLVPFALFSTPIPLVGWGIVLLSGVLEALYYLLLGRAYQAGDFSLVYPLARGSAPLFATLLAIIAKREFPTWGGLAGILLIVCGIYTLHITAFDRKGLTAPLLALRGGLSRLALLLGLIIASYTVVDSFGVRYADPLTYLYLILAVPAVLLAPYMLLSRRRVVLAEARRSFAAVPATAGLFVGAYLLVLLALRTAAVAYVSSVREISVVFAAALGTLVLREAFGEKKILGSLLIFAGIVCIGLGS
jgi:drug/metabolite transporter (DMT)-like permease